VASAVEAAFEDPACLGEHVLIVDECGGYLPLGLADLLLDAEVNVHLLSPNLVVGEEMMKTNDLHFILPTILAKGGCVSPQHFVERIAPGEAEIYSIWGGSHTRLRADTVVFAAMRIPDDALYHRLRERSPQIEVHRVGDAVAPRKLEAIVYEGEKLGREI
jgi:hypothetical protein